MGHTIIENEEKMIQEILEHFDYAKCERVMKKINWTWGFQEGVPTIEDLKRASIERLKSAMELAKQGKSYRATYFSSSGGLKANAWVNRYGHIEGIKLEFVLTDWDSDGDV